jgi:hypothetical protein
LWHSLVKLCHLVEQVCNLFQAQVENLCHPTAAKPPVTRPPAKPEALP